MTIDVLEDAAKNLACIDNVIQKLRSDNARMREALSFYADENNMRSGFPTKASPGLFDQGQRARQCLKELGG
jgi:hypothetical protein